MSGYKNTGPWTGAQVDALLGLAGSAIQPEDVAAPTGEGQADGLLTHQDKAKLDGLGSAASCDIGTGSGDVAAGDHGHATAAPSGEGVPGSDGFLSAADKAKLDGLGTAAYTDSSAYAASGHDHDSAYAAAAKGVTNGDNHDHAGGDGAQIAYANLSGTPTLGTAAAKNVGTGATEVAAGNHTHTSLTTPTLDNPTITNGYKEEVGTSVPSTLDPANGSIQKFTLTGNLDFTSQDALESGESLTVMVKKATFTLTWPTVVWVGGVAPTLSASNFNVIEFWKVGTTLYGAAVGEVAS